MGFKIGSALGNVEDSVVYEYPEKAKIVKIKVAYNVQKPIIPGLYIGHQSDGTTWVDFRYEGLPMFCFNCGLVGHIEANCIYEIKYNKAEGEINPVGAWLRSNVYRKRVLDDKDKMFSSNPLRSASRGQFSPVPEALLRKMAEVSMKEQAAQQQTEGNEPRTQQQRVGLVNAGIKMNKQLGLVNAEEQRVQIE
ncbi:F-box/FBD/LRR-repeat protein [Trifolium medium]|uniref:F-box/FBD/LRR-repeat protein n=1 Tax=Trifolium medium TaxID=97028 RepID=A0A392M0L6_9FABA|nr:F-box/FBD/LRR-repeat protein [Trifolium medium]